MVLHWLIAQHMLETKPQIKLEIRIKAISLSQKNIIIRAKVDWGS